MDIFGVFEYQLASEIDQIIRTWFQECDFYSALKIRNLDKPTRAIAYPSMADPNWFFGRVLSLTSQNSTLVGLKKRFVNSRYDKM